MRLIQGKTLQKAKLFYYRSCFFYCKTCLLTSTKAILQHSNLHFSLIKSTGYGNLCSACSRWIFPNIVEKVWHSQLIHTQIQGSEKLKPNFSFDPDYKQYRQMHTERIVMTILIGQCSAVMLISSISGYLIAPHKNFTEGFFAQVPQRVKYSMMSK